MKSLEDLKKLKDSVQIKIKMRDFNPGTRILVCMATCGIKAGAREVINKFMEEISEKKLEGVTVAPIGCIGTCSLEPIVEVHEGENKTIYCQVDEVIAKRIINEHILGGKIVNEFVKK